MDLVQITSNLRLFGYAFRATNPDAQQASVSSTLTPLVQSGEVVRVARGMYTTPAIVGTQGATSPDMKSRVLAEFDRTEARLPFVGLKHFRDRIMPIALDGFGSIELRQRILEELIDQGELEVYDEPNPTQPEHPTAALRRPVG
jgi:hypothetical protein